MNRIVRIASHVNSGVAGQEHSLGAQPTAGYCAAEKGEDDVVICCAVRTALCKAKRGSFKDTAPELLLAAVFKEVVARTKVNPKDIGDIQIGNVLQPGASGLTSRMGQFIAELPYEIPLSTVNRQCSSSLQATASIAAFIKAGVIDVGLAGGVENMSMFPMMATIDITKLSKDVLDYPNAEVGVDPKLMGIGPAFAIPPALQQAGLKVEDIDIYEINEAFASQATMSVDHLKIPMEKVNPKGGAIALGHPLGATGARQIATLLPELKRQGKKLGVTSMCLGSGMGAASVIELE